MKPPELLIFNSFWALNSDSESVLGLRMSELDLMFVCISQLGMSFSLISPKYQAFLFYLYFPPVSNVSL